MSSKRGRPQSPLDWDHILSELAAGITKEEIMQRYNVTRTAINTHLRVDGPSPERKKCNTCIYRETAPGRGSCNYLMITGHSRGCEVIGCKVYVKGRPKHIRRGLNL